MSNFSDFLKSLNIEVSIVSESYVYYDPLTGKIVKITNKFDHDETLAVLEVPHDLVSDIINGTKSSENFVVEYDVASKQLALKEKTYEEHLTKIESRLHRLPVVRTTVDETGDKTSIIFDSIYDGVEVFLWTKNSKHFKDSLIWYENNVYKLLNDIDGSKFDKTKAELFVSNVIISDIKSLNHFIEYKTSFEPIFEGIHVDIWYRELSHLKGQHVWAHNTVYRYKEDIPANEPFNLDYLDIIEENVFLYDDSNKYLSFVSILSPGDKILDNNKLYMFVNKKLNIDVNEKSILFYSSSYECLHYDESKNKLTKFSFLERNNKLSAKTDLLSDDLKLSPSMHISNGQKILIGKSLYQANTLDERDIDINVVQNNLTGCWEIYLGRKTKKSLELINYIGHDTLYFSVTAKHDPNVLYRTMEFSLTKLLNDKVQKYPYQFKWESDREDVSVYTSKFFESYSHEILE